MKVAEIFAELGFNIKDSNLGDFVNALSKIDLLTATTALGLGSIYLALNKITTEAVAAANSLTNFNAQTGLSSEELQRWQMLGKQAGITEEDVTSSFKAIQSSLTAISKGGGNAAPFQWLGLNAADLNKKFNSGAAGTRDAILDISAALGKVSESDRRFFASQMGVNDAMAQFLTSSKLTREALDAQGIMTDDQRIRLRQLSEEAIKLGDSMREFGYAIATFIAPVLIGLVRIGQGFVDLYQKSLPFKVYINTLLIGITALFIALLTPLMMVGAGIAAVIVALGLIAFYWDDIKKAAQGAGEAVTQFFNQIMEGSKPVIDVLNKINSLIKFSPIGFGENMGEAAMKAFMPNMRDNGGNDYSNSRQENNLTVTVAADHGGNKSIVDTIEESWNKMTGRAAYQRKLKAT